VVGTLGHLDCRSRRLAERLGILQKR
jgi:hypothetical protein